MSFFMFFHFLRKQDLDGMLKEQDKTIKKDGLAYTVIGTRNEVDRRKSRVGTLSGEDRIPRQSVVH